MSLLDPRILEQQRDLRRPAHYRDTPQRELLRRAELLPPRDRLLVQLALENQVSRRRLAQIMNMPPGSVTRRLQRLGARLNDPLVLALLRDHCPLPPEYRQLGVEHFLRGQPMCELADAHRMSLNEVRRIITYLRGWHRGLCAAR